MTCCICWCEAPRGDVAGCVHAGKNGFLGDCAMLHSTARVVCRHIIGGWLGREDAQISDALRSAEGLGCGDVCWDGQSYAPCMQRDS